MHVSKPKRLQSKTFICQSHQSLLQEALILGLLVPALGGGKQSPPRPRKVALGRVM